MDRPVDREHGRRGTDDWHRLTRAAATVLWGGWGYTVRAPMPCGVGLFVPVDVAGRRSALLLSREFCAQGRSDAECLEQLRTALATLPSAAGGVLVDADGRLVDVAVRWRTYEPQRSRSVTPTRRADRVRATVPAALRNLHERAEHAIASTRDRLAQSRDVLERWRDRERMRLRDRARA